MGSMYGSSIWGKNYYVDWDGTNGIGNDDGSGSDDDRLCASDVCEQKDAAWLRDSLNEASAFLTGAVDHDSDTEHLILHGRLGVAIIGGIWEYQVTCLA